MDNLFIELLQVSLGNRDSLTRILSEDEWRAIFTIAEQQAVAGVLIDGVNRLPQEQWPSKEILREWFVLTLQIEARNEATTRACAELCEQFERDGFSVCILKGQANHRYYPEGMGERRSCGDVDLWTRPVEKGRNDVRCVLEYVRSKFKMNGLCWLHCSFKYKNDVPIEIHFHPSFFSEPRKNRRFQKHFSDLGKCRSVERVDGVYLPVMSIDEDLIFQMNHIYRHLIDEGIGLRQIVDYYMLLRSWNGRHNRSKDETMRIVSHLGMKRFSGALMFVLQDALGMPSEELLCPASEKDGRFLMSEILLSGNFGRSDPRMETLPSEGYYRIRVMQALRRFKRNMRFLASYPGEVIWEPIVRFTHYLWKKLALWKLS